MLAPHGSIVIELGDTYAGNGGAGGDYLVGGLREGQPAFRANRGLERAESYDGGGSDHHDFAKAGTKSRGAAGTGWPLDKSLALVPESFRWALAYGRNPFNGRTTPPWRVRNVVRWHRPNPPVGALGDKFRPATSELVVACKARDRYFDLDAVREPYKGHHKMGEPVGGRGADYDAGVRSSWTNRADVLREDRGGAPPLDTCVIPTARFAGAHYATYPPDLCIKPILAMCPERVCRVCSEPSRRITTTEQVDTGRTTNGAKPRDRAESFAGTTYATRTVSEVSTLGWTDCGHADYRPGLVLDPFAGSGTTLAVAMGHGRDAIGIDLDPRNADLARDRVGMWLIVEPAA